MSRYDELVFRIDGVRLSSTGVANLTKVTLVTLRRVVRDLGGLGWNECEDTYTLPVDMNGGVYASSIGCYIKLKPEFVQAHPEPMNSSAECFQKREE